MRQPGLPGLALVLALTMVLGFAATASASYGYGRFEHDLFAVDPTYTINGESGTEFDVEGNKEYTVKAKIHVNNIANYPDVIDTIYDDVDEEYQVLELINQYANFGLYASADWDANDLYDDDNPLYQAAVAVVGGDANAYSTIFNALYRAVQSTGSFEKGYKANIFTSAVRDLDRAVNNSHYGANSYYGYDDGIAAYATSKDATYATVTSAPTIKYTREDDGTYCNVEFKVRFTNTTFRTADVDVEIQYLSGGSDSNIRYEHTDTLSFTVFQARGAPAGHSRIKAGRKSNDGCPRCGVGRKEGLESLTAQAYHLSIPEESRMPCVTKKQQAPKKAAGRTPRGSFPSQKAAGCIASAAFPLRG